MKSFREHVKLQESPVGMVGRTKDIEAAEHIENSNIAKEFRKIVKKLGGKNVARQLLAGMDNSGTKVEVTDGKINEHVHVDKLYDALDGKDSEEFIMAMYDWFDDNYPEASLYAGDDVPEDFIEYLELKDKRKLIQFYTDMKKEGFVK